MTTVSPIPSVLSSTTGRPRLFGTRSTYEKFDLTEFIRKIWIANLSTKVFGRKTTKGAFGKSKYRNRKISLNAA
jgi:hypothetical protein